MKWGHGEGKIKTKKMLEDKAWRMLQVSATRPCKRHTSSISHHRQFFNNRDDADVTNGLSVPVFMDWLEELDPIVSIDDTYMRASAALPLNLQHQFTGNSLTYFLPSYVMCGNLSMLLRGVSRAFGIPCRVAVAFQPTAGERWCCCCCSVFCVTRCCSQVAAGEWP